MILSVFSPTLSESLLERLDARLDLLFAEIVRADSAAISGWLETGYLLVTFLLLGIPLLSVLMAVCANLSGLAVGQGGPRLRTLLGLPENQASGQGGDLLQKLQVARETLPRSLVFLLLVGLVPVLGTLIGVLYYRLSPIPALGKGVKASTLGPVRWILPVCTVTLVALQPFPMIGPLCLPLLYAILHSVYDSALRQQEALGPGSQNYCGHSA